MTMMKKSSLLGVFRESRHDWERDGDGRGKFASEFPQARADAGLR